LPRPGAGDWLAERWRALAIARFLIARPGSTQGTRAYRPAPEAMPQVALFGARIRELLAHPLVTDAHRR
jgi:hypothetical protein